MADTPEDLTEMWRKAGEAIGENLRRSWYEAIAQGKRIYLSDRPGSLESKVQAAFDRNPNLPRDELERIIGEHLTGRSKGSQPPQKSPVWAGMPPKNPLPPLPHPPPPPNPPPPLPPPDLSPPPAPPAPVPPSPPPAPAPVPPPQQPVPEGSPPAPMQPRQPTWMPPRPAPPPPPNQFPSGMYPPPPPPPPPYNYAVPPTNVFPHSMQAAARPYIHPTPPPDPTFGQRLGHHFSQIVARQAHYGYVNIGHAAKGAFTAAAPETAIPLEIINAAQNTLKEAARNLQEFARTTVEANRALSRYSPLLATEFARFEIGQYTRNLSLARFTETSGAGAVRAFGAFQDARFPYDVAAQNFANSGAGFIAGAGAGAANELRALPEILEFLRSSLDPTGNLVTQVGEVVGKAVATAVLSVVPGGGALIPPLLQWLKRQLGAPDIKPGPPAGGAWDLFGANMAGAFPMAPINGKVMINPMFGRKNP